MRKKIVYIVGLLLVMMFMSGCVKPLEENGEAPNTETEKTQSATELYLVLSHNTMEETMTLYNYTTGYEHYYEYTYATEFADKYGNYESAVAFVPGSVVTIGTPNESGHLTAVQMSEDVWRYEKIKQFSILEEDGIFTIAGTKYSIRDGVVVFSGTHEIALDEISEDDVLQVTGIGKKILSIIVTTGHGTLSLSNTGLFEGSLMQLNKDRFIRITKNLEVEVPEGNYTLTVANNGWGGSCEIEVVRGETTKIDLDTLKGEGKKKGLVTFSVEPLDAVVSINYKEVDISEPVELTYGTYVLEVEAEGYEKWKKYLTVNSKTATIVIELTEDEKTSTSETTEDTETTETTESTEATEKEEESEKLEVESELEDVLEELLGDTYDTLFG